MEITDLTIEESTALIREKVAKMESGKLTLDENIKLYSEVTELIAYSLKLLDGYRGKVKDVGERFAELKNGGGKSGAQVEDLYEE